jgi:hypothetical protein
MRKFKTAALLMVILASLQFISCKKETQVAPSYKTSETLQEIIKNKNIKRVIASDTQNFLFELSFNDEYGFDFTFKENFVGTYGAFWNLDFLKRYEVVQRGDGLVLLLLFDN